MNEQEPIELIEASYTRIPQTTNYRGNVSQGLYLNGQGENEPHVLTPIEGLKMVKFDASPMEVIVSLLHDALQELPKAHVLMTQVGKDGVYLQKKVLANKLSDDLRDLIRDNLDQAVKQFAPIERTVHVRKEVPCQSQEIES